LFTSFRGQQQPKPAASTRLRFDTDFSAHSLNRFTHDGKPNPRALIVSRAMESLEHQKHSILGFRRYSDAVIFHPESHIILQPLGPNLNVRLRAFGHKFYGIAQKVKDALSKGTFMAQKRQQRRANFNFGVWLLKRRMFLNDLPN